MTFWLSLFKEEQEEEQQKTFSQNPILPLAYTLDFCVVLMNVQAVKERTYICRQRNHSFYLV